MPVAYTVNTNKSGIGKSLGLFVGGIKSDFAVGRYVGFPLRMHMPFKS